MHLKTPDEGMTLDQKEISSANIANKTPSPLITSNKPVLTEKEPRPVYISLRESKLSASAPAGPTYDKSTIDERLNIMPVLNDNLIGDGIEYVTLEECRLIADENLVSEQTDYNVGGITDISDIRHSMPNTSGVKVLVQPLFVQPENQQVDEFTMSMQTNQHQPNNTGINTSGIVTGGSNMIPISNFNPSLPTEPLPYEETMTMQKCVIEVSSPCEKENIDASEGSSNGSGRNYAYLDSSNQSLLQYNQMQTSLYPSNDMGEINKVSDSRFQDSSQLQTTKTDFEQIRVSPNATVTQGVSPQSSTSPTYSLSESPYIHISAATNDPSSQRRISTNFDSNGPISPSESSSSSGSQESSISSTSKQHPMFMEDKRIRQYSESCILPNAIVSSTRARHQSDGNVNSRTRAKRLQANRSSVDANKTSAKNLAGKRRSKHPMPEDSKDDKYWRRRAKNNEAAKRSREAKRMKEDEVLQKVEGLESENEILRRKLEEAKSEIRVLKAQLDKN